MSKRAEQGVCEMNVHGTRRPSRNPVLPIGLRAQTNTGDLLLTRDSRTFGAIVTTSDPDFTRMAGGPTFDALPCACRRAQ